MRRPLIGEAIALKKPRNSKTTRSGKSKGGRPTKAEAEERRLRVLRIATGLFVEEGFSTTSLDQIARIAGVAKRTLYNDFGDKGGLFYEVVIQRTMLNGVIEEFVSHPDEPASVSLIRAAESLCNICLSEDTIVLCRMIISEVQRFPELMHQLLSDGNNNLIVETQTLLSRMHEHGSLPAQDDWHQTAKIFVDMIVGTASLHATGGYYATIPGPDEIRRKVAIFIAGIEAAGSATPPQPAG